MTPRAKERLRRGKGAYTLKTPSSLSAAKAFLRDISHTEMVRLCVNCHRYITGAPDPSVDHSGGAPGTQCSLPHHPQPCPGTDRRGHDCQYEESRDDDLGVRLLDDERDDLGTGGPGLVSSQGPEVNPLQALVDQLQRERDEERRQVELLQMRNNNLQNSQSALSQQLLSQQGMFAGTVVSSSATLSTSTSTTTISGTPRMGTGYSSCLVTPITVHPAPAACTVF